MEFSLSTTQGYVFIISFLMTVGLFYSVLFFAFRRKVSYVFFIALCFFHILKILFRPDQDMLEASAFWEQLFVAYKHIPFMFGSISLMGFLVFEFNLDRKQIILGVYILLVWAFYLLRIPSFGLVIFYALGIAVLALKKDREGGIYAIVGLALFGLFTRVEFMQNLGIAYYLGVITFMIAMTLLVGQRIKKTIRDQREAQMKSVNLENQLLKSTIQPHFITNSLTSLQELIDTDPGGANRFIENLAEEFRLFSEMSDHKLVPLDQELALCKNHLKIMEKRKQGSYQLETENVQGNELVPPGIFHTLIENGLTHGFRRKKDGRFSLEKRSSEDKISYFFSNDGDCEDVLETKEGTGFKYIRNRLIENFGENWSLETGINDGMYQVAITVPK